MCGLLTGTRDAVAERCWLAELSGNLDVDAAGAQWVLAPEPVIHRGCAQPQAYARACLPPAGRQLLSIDRRTLSACQELREPDGGEQASHHCVAVRGGGEQGTQWCSPVDVC